MAVAAQVDAPLAEGTLWGPEPFAVWETATPGPPDPAFSWDGRANRRIVVIAPAHCEHELSAWTWSRGDPELTPFAKYLLHAAKARYQLRVWAAERAENEDLRTETNDAVGPLLRLIDTAAENTSTPDQSALRKASARLVRVQSRQLGLVERASRLREMRRTIAIAATNLAAHADHDQKSGLFADDKALLDWLDHQLDNDATYIEASLERARAVTALADQFIQRAQQSRQERFSLALTGVVSAVLMVLAAVQSLQYRVDIPGRVQPAVVSSLGAFALLASVIVLRVAVPDRRWTQLAVCDAAALLGGTVSWTIAASYLVPGNAEAPPAALWAWGAVGAVVGLAVAVAFVTWGRIRTRTRR